MSFISLDAPSEAIGFPDANPPITMATEGIDNRYMITIKSPIKPVPGDIFMVHKNVDTSVTAASPIMGAIRNVALEAVRGIMVSLPRSFMISANGWYHGGPTLHWTLAVTFLSIQLARSPAAAVNKNPGNIKNWYNSFISF